MTYDTFWGIDVSTESDVADTDAEPLSEDLVLLAGLR
jgi:hypothetical protein